ncbi:hypothetical protein QTJ16_003258 [Diplocarpon rosae]|uniref:Uncharacterized protein n=1 Tax=Diplocarpon rosae TaxID=946125 RepID=A0AAD9T271_9HELO|nr:hypothetical protein QTJ16_003258 [Diplocarpon rosae]PBP25323.1 hypothetical protein BUE80_DR003780 [Diplocarpon rosae]
MATLREAARRRLNLDPLNTSLNSPPHQHQHQHQHQHYYHQTHQTPSSALSARSLSAPFGYNPSAFTPVNAVGNSAYNPAQWSNSPSVTPDSSSHLSPGHSSSRAQDVEATSTPLLPPPPYSPPRPQRTLTRTSEEPPAGDSTASRLSPAQQYQSSPEPASNPTFPLPPNTRARAGSNDRASSLLNISSFSRRITQDVPGLASEIRRDHAPNPRRPVPIALEPPLSEAEGSQLIESLPPASRRAVSTGAISTPSSSSSHSLSTSRWAPGMPLPPPPPGPPPASSRSQSMSRSTDRIVSPPTRRPGAISTLGPVPPTPAEWVGEDNASRGRPPNRGLNIDTSSVSSKTVAGSPSSSSSLARAHAVRGEKSLRERRTESKTRKSAVTAEETSSNPRAESITPSDIILPQTLLSQRPILTHSTPRSARSHHLDTPRSANNSQHNTPVTTGPGTGSRGSTPRPHLSSSRPGAPTPPFSPHKIKAALAEGTPAIAPQCLPTPPPQSRPTPSSSGRPVSHILHTPNNDGVTIAPLVPSRPGSRQSNHSQRSRISSAEQFSRAAMDRHQEFALKEAAAANDGERVRMFAEFIVTESRLRRERYASAIDDMGSEILELTRDLFRPFSSPKRASTLSRPTAWTPESSTGPRSPEPPGMRTHRGPLMAALHDTPKLEIATESSSSASPTSTATGRPESMWWKGYMPSLSPIPSMSVSEAFEGSDSRGRPSSRWWEVSQEGSNGTPSLELKRSKQESKYMGMPRELREALQYENSDPRIEQNGKAIDMSETDEQKGCELNEYPPEKVGWHEADTSSSSRPEEATRSPAPFSSTPPIPNPKHLDVSRLVTLPPPYPRHYPAVNNNHPDLTSIRTAVRALSDFTEVEATKERFSSNSAQIRQDLATETSKRRNSLRINIQREVSSGQMTYADAAKVEATALATEQEKTRDASKTAFELFQSQVVMPLNDLLMGRVARATELFTQLRSKLFVDAQQQSPNVAQEEGDEQPELLEKLTLLKWIFEARELLHRELFDLLSDRNDRYRDMVVAPYRLAGNAEKVHNAELFFAEDASKRRLAFEQEILKRTEEFMDVIEENVVRGVEVQLSAFWDIAPSLSRITERIPHRVDESFQIQIPAREYEENPSYYEFPMQYLYSLLGHCEKSTYQFIESQTNLLCLLHEVKSGVTLANCRLMRTQRIVQGESEGEVERELKKVEADEEVRLTDDLKEKVRCVEELWSSALGRELKGVKARVVRFLIEQGGWDEDE